MADLDGSDASPPGSQALAAEEAMPQGKRQERRGSGAARRRGKRSPRRAGSRSATPALFTITEEEEGQRRRGAGRSKKKDSLLFNRIDERLRLARERRGELEKQNGAYPRSFCHV
ncbi:unnamed protein product [Tetraodon nigroviridis]|uniref:(spotted green pufferfish) hypothetical protein n=1 Tax=Tetraodon nigroviridis TaxID=99883 RepID=Q4RR99_TETNG|nr:unnamed protein product [Tetraodon nigroviridis]